MTVHDALRLIGLRMDAGKYYGWELMYNRLIDWSGDELEALPREAEPAP